MIYLHHYDASLFSEKVRLMLGYLGLPWQSVNIPNIMPRPLLMPLSGGYRKTPCLQIDANVFCDTAVITQGLVRESGDTTLLQHGFPAYRVAEWADSQLFRVTVALNFRPEALGPMMAQMSQTDIEAFQKDRAELSKGAPIVSYSAEAALGFLSTYVDQLEETFARSGKAFLFGENPSVADFSIYHCLWFIRNNPVNAPLIESHPEVGEWYARMKAFGHGEMTLSDGEAALAAAKDAEPVVPALSGRCPDGVAIGDSVSVMPIDYGRIPVMGTLVAMGVDEIVVERESAETGRVMTHFPSAGFELVKVQG